MIPQKAVKVEPICEASKLGNLSSPFTVHSDKIFMVSHSGEILKLENNSLKVDSHMGGQPNAIVVSQDEKNYFVADLAHQAIFMKSLEEENTDFTKFVFEFEGIPLIGPNSLALSSNQQLFFTDSGPWGETSIENKRGSVFLVDLMASIVRPLALNCLAFPSGIALGSTEK
jgi:sugar lactone lactonase YvrE